MIELFDIILFGLIGLFMLIVLRQLEKLRSDLDHEIKVRLVTCERIAKLEELLKEKE